MAFKVAASPSTGFRRDFIPEMHFTQFYSNEVTTTLSEFNKIRLIDTLIKFVLIGLFETAWV